MKQNKFRISSTIGKNLLWLWLKKDLSGIPSIQLEEITPPKKGIATTRSFEGTLTRYSDLEERISTFATSCAEKMRKQRSSCNAEQPERARRHRHRIEAG